MLTWIQDCAVNILLRSFYASHRFVILIDFVMFMNAVLFLVTLLHNLCNRRVLLVYTGDALLELERWASTLCGGGHEQKGPSQ